MCPALVLLVCYLTSLLHATSQFEPLSLLVIVTSNTRCFCSLSIIVTQRHHPRSSLQLFAVRYASLYVHHAKFFSLQESILLRHVIHCSPLGISQFSSPLSTFTYNPLGHSLCLPLRLHLLLPRHFVTLSVPLLFYSELA